MTSTRNLSVALVQWLPTPGAPDDNLAEAVALIRDAANQGADVIVLSELWLCGYDAARLASDAVAAAEPIPGPRSSVLQALAAELGVWLVAGSIPESGDGGVYNTAVVFNRQGTIVAMHRKQHLYEPTGEDKIFLAGDSVTTFHDDELGTVGLTVCFDGDFPTTAAALAERGADLIFQVNAYEVEAESYWDTYYPGAAISQGQWWVLCNQCGTNDSGTILGASRIIAPTGVVVAEATRAGLGETPAGMILSGAIMDTDETREAQGFSAMLR